jgi:hypothetical protein
MHTHCTSNRTTAAAATTSHSNKPALTPQANTGSQHSETLARNLPRLAPSLPPKHQGTVQHLAGPSNNCGSLAEFAAPKLLLLLLLLHPRQRLADPKLN